MNLSISIFLILCTCATLAHKSYKGYEVYSTKPVWEDVMGILSKIVQDSRFDVWNTPHVGQPVRLLTSSHYSDEAFRKLTFMDLDPVVTITNIDHLFGESIMEHETRKIKNPLKKGNVTFDRYMDLQEITEYLESVSEKMSDKATLINIGTSSEGRPIYVIHFASDVDNIKNAIWVDCGMYGREWMSPSVCLKLILQLTRDSSLLDDVEWYVLPVLNPDGYHYSWTEDLFWMKTRSQNSVKPECIGTNINRNFGYLWNADNYTSPCSNTYPGPYARSEPEVDAISEALAPLVENDMIIAHISVHTQSQMILYPLSYASALVMNGIQLQEAGDAAADAIFNVGNFSYGVQIAGEVLYPTFGTLEDYAHILGINYSYTLELPFHDEGLYNPPESEISNTVTALTAGIRALVEHILESMQSRLRDEL